MTYICVGRHRMSVHRERVYLWMLLLLVVLSASGLVASVAVHVGALLGRSVIGTGMVVLLHVGAVLLGAAVAGIAQLRLFEVSLPRGSRDILSGAPRWMRWTLGALLIYGVAGFVFGRVMHDSAVTGAEPGQPMATGTLVSFSRLWLFFYYAEAVSIFSAIRLQIGKCNETGQPASGPNRR